MDLDYSIYLLKLEILFITEKVHSLLCWKDTHVFPIKKKNSTKVPCTCRKRLARN